MEEMFFLKLDPHRLPKTLRPNTLRLTMHIAISVSKKILGPLGQFRTMQQFVSSCGVRKI